MNEIINTKLLGTPKTPGYTEWSSIMNQVDKLNLGQQVELLYTILGAAIGQWHDKPLAPEHRFVMHVVQEAFKRQKQ